MFSRSLFRAVTLQALGMDSSPIPAELTEKSACPGDLAVNRLDEPVLQTTAVTYTAALLQLHLLTISRGTPCPASLW